MNDELKEQLDHYLALMSKHELLELEIARDGFKVRLKKKYEPVRNPVVAVSGLTSIPVGATLESAATAPGGVPAIETGLREIKSPMVGTFYEAPSPDSTAYVSVGDDVTEDSVVCCIEAMKVFNEIKAECAGTIVQALAENGQVVEYGQPLFLIRETDG